MTDFSGQIENAGHFLFCRILANNSDICFSKTKEPHLLMRADISDREIVTGYSNLYASCDRSVVFADGSTGYSKLPWCSRVPVRARRILGEDVQIVFINRNRLDRSVSHHNHLARAEPSFPSNFEHAVSRDKSIVRFSLYAPVIRCWLDHFDKANLHLVDFDVLTKDPLQAINPIRKKLGLPELYRSEDLQAPHENLGADQLLPPPSISGLVRRVTRSRAYIRFSHHSHIGVETCSMYWYYVGALWLVLFPLIYLN